MLICCAPLRRPWAERVNCSAASRRVPRRQLSSACCSCRLLLANCAACSRPWVCSSGQRPWVCRLACSVPALGQAWSSALALPGDSSASKARSGARVASVGACTLASHLSAAGAPPPWPCRLMRLPPMLSSACSCAAAPWLCSARLPDSGTPASRLSPRLSLAWPLTAASRRSMASSPARVAGAGRHSSWALASACSRCGPRRQVEPSGPRHQGRGSKSARVAWPATRQPWPSARAWPLNRAKALPARASAWSICRWLALASATRRNCTGRPAVPCQRPLSCASTASVGVGAAESALGPAAVGRPRRRSVSGPPSSIAAALRCRRAGCSCVACKSSARASPCQLPLPLMRPALPAASPSSSWKPSSTRRSVWSGRPLACSCSWRSGRRPASQGPGRLLSRVALNAAGRSRPWVCRVAWPDSRVSGSCGDSAARFSASVCS